MIDAAGTLALCIPARHAARHLPRLLDSVRRQTHPFDEVWLYDDASTDDTGAMARAFGATVVRSDVNTGPSPGKNLLAQKTTASWVHFHDADEALQPEFVARARTWMARDQDDVVLFGTEDRDDATAELLLTRQWDAADVARDAVAYCIANTVTNCGIYRRRAFLEAGGFDSNDDTKYNEDQAMHLRLALAGLPGPTIRRRGRLSARAVDVVRPSDRVCAGAVSRARQHRQLDGYALRRADRRTSLAAGGHPRRISGLGSRPALSRSRPASGIRGSARRASGRAPGRPRQPVRRHRGPRGIHSRVQAAPAAQLSDRRMTMRPLVSILVPCHNSEAWIDRTLESALAQTYPRCEIIVVDDGSTDGTPTRLRGYEARGVRIVTQANRGASAARNRALAEASGELIQFLDADDLLAPGKVAAQVALLEQRGFDLVASGAWGRFVENPADAPFAEQPIWRDLRPIDFLVTCALAELMFPPSAWLVPRRLCDKAGPGTKRFR